MTRKDFALIAETIRDLGAPAFTQATARAFALRLRATNHRFDALRFLLACGLAADVAATLAEEIEKRKPIFG